MKRSNAKEVIILAPQHLDRRILVKKDDLPKDILKFISSCPFQYVPWKDPNMTSFGTIPDLFNLHCFSIFSSFHVKNDEVKPDKIANMKGSTTSHMCFTRSPICAQLQPYDIDIPYSISHSN
jgi:hypothetical protein